MLCMRRLIYRRITVGGLKEASLYHYSAMASLGVEYAHTSFPIVFISALGARDWHGWSISVHYCRPRHMLKVIFVRPLAFTRTPVLWSFRPLHHAQTCKRCCRSLLTWQSPPEFFSGREFSPSWVAGAPLELVFWVNGIELFPYGMITVSDQSIAEQFFPVILELTVPRGISISLVLQYSTFCPRSARFLRCIDSARITCG